MRTNSQDTFHTSFTSEGFGSGPSSRQVSCRGQAISSTQEHEEEEHLQNEFERLAGDGVLITSAKFHELIHQQNPGSWMQRWQVERILKRIAKVVASRRTLLAQSSLLPSNSSLGSSKSTYECKGMDFEMFSVLMCTPDLSELTGENAQDFKDFAFLQDTLVEACADRLVSKLVNVRTDELVGITSMNFRERAQTYSEHFISGVIVLNAIMIGVATDTDWSFADYCELAFVLIFLFEQICKLLSTGCRYHFFGPDYLWNWFDCMILILAVFDVVNMFILNDDEGLSGLSAVRILRLLRFVRLVRLMKSFKELSLMVNGLVGGMRTLFWAIILLGASVYVLGVLLTQLNRGVETDLLDLDLYFSTVPLSMLTVFQCFTEGFADHDGRPLLPQMVQVHGPLFAIAYCIVIILTLFGLFNLVAAIFVENTLQAAKNNDMKIATARRREDVRVAKKVKELIGKFSFLQSEASKGSRPKSVLELNRNLGTLSISRKEFEEVMEKEDVHRLLQELDLSLTERFGLFDVLDADGDGTLQLTEIVAGMLQVRGEARKSDVVAIKLAVRSLQKRVSLLEQVSIKNQSLILERVEQLQEQFTALHGNQQLHESDTSLQSWPTNELSRMTPPTINGKGQLREVEQPLQSFPTNADLNQAAELLQGTSEPMKGKKLSPADADLDQAPKLSRVGSRGYSL